MTKVYRSTGLNIQTNNEEFSFNVEVEGIVWFGFNIGVKAPSGWSADGILDITGASAVWSGPIGYFLKGQIQLSNGGSTYSGSTFGTFPFKQYIPKTSQLKLYVNETEFTNFSSSDYAFLFLEDAQ